MSKKIAFYGAGAMAQAIIQGMLKSGLEPENIIIYNRTLDRARDLAEKWGLELATNPKELVQSAQVLFLAVKPYAIGPVSAEVKEELDQETLVVSMAAGYSLDDLVQNLPGQKLLRIMPNLAAKEAASMTVYSLGQEIGSEEEEVIDQLLALFGSSQKMEEKDLDLAMIINGCGPAFMAQFAEGLADACVRHGLKRQVAYDLIAQTLIGTGALMQAGQIPAQIKDQVSSPAGVTIEGVLALEKAGLRSIMIEAVDACVNWKKE